MRKPELGKQQLEVLQYVTDRGPSRVSEVAEHFGATQGLARTTILSVMERLREKGYLGREKQDGVYVYTSRAPKAQLLRSLIDDFVRQALGGSTLPLVAYLAENSRLSDDEVLQLKQLVRDLEQPGADVGKARRRRSP